MESTTGKPVTATTSAANLEKEIRFAVVMYGGVSLAVYINGVAQELLHMVRATTPHPDNPDSLLLNDSELVGTESVYLELAQIVGASGPDPEKAGGPVRTRFMVDILSGTSAGRLNAIFLAKALANQSDFDALKELWLNTADVGVLLNDDLSVVNTPLKSPHAPASVLNGQKFYYELLEALDKMDRNGTRAKTSPYQDELDLFVTATDLHGLRIPMQLADGVVYERRHRNVFRFRYDSIDSSKVKNDFDGESNPFLAFSGRCTAAFPIAFEPMRLRNMDEILARLDDHRDKPDERSTSKLWQQFVEDYIPEDGPFNDNLAPGGNGSRFQNRSFADGGYLNNKPFSYAIEEIGARMGDLPSERKLVYVEPSPESLRDTPPPENKPEFIDNSIDAAFSLPGYQTIREDLWRVVERNRLVTRVQEIVSQSENELKTFAENQLSEIIKKLDPSFRAYEGLRVKAVTDELALMATRALGGDDSGDDLRAIYYLTRAWREEKTEGGSPLDGDSFLNQYDLSFRIRRFRLLLTKLDLLHIGGEKARTVLTTAFAPGPIPDETDLRAG